MKTKFTFFVATLCICGFFFITPFKVSAQTNVSGPQSGTWLKDSSPYVIMSNVTIPVGQTLTIQAGVTVRFTNGNNSTSQLIVQGTLKAQGTGTDSIYFTGLGLGQYQQAGPITIEAVSTNSILQYINMNGIGYYYNSDYTPALIVRSNFCTIQNCTIQNMRGCALQIDQSTPVVHNNFFSNSGLDIIADLDKLKYITNNNPLKVGLTHQLDMSNSRDTLKANNTYYKMLANQTIPISKTLIIQPGTTLQFTNGNNTISQLDVQGTLLAQGSDTNNIKFTGLGLGQYQQCGPLTIEALSYGSILQYITISGLGYYYNSDYTPAIIVRSNTCSIINCFIQNSAGTALQIDKCSPVISNNTFSNPNKLDVITDFDKIRYLKNNNALKIGLTAEALMGSNDTLNADNTYYRILFNQTIPQSKTLVINPGVTMQFPNGNNTVSQLIIEGTLKALGTSDEPISFSGFNLGQYQQTGPITFQSTSIDSKLQFVNFSNLGYYYSNTSNTSILNISSSSLNITNCSFTNNRGIAVNISNLSSPFFKRNCFISNSAAILSSSGKAIIDSCNFIGNTAYGLNNTSTTDTINAVDCFWGDISGPKAGTNSGSGDSVSVNVIYMPFSQTQFDCSEPVLPVTLLNLKANYASAKFINCSWQTASESNSNYFSVQRSTNGTAFFEIGKVTASGNSSTLQSYTYLDNAFNELNASKLFYRLQEVDKDGKKQYSNVVYVNLENNNKMFVYPVPANNIINVSLTQLPSQNAFIMLYNINGKIVLQQKLESNNIRQQLNVASLAAGNYNLVFMNNNQKVSSSQILIQH